jgi:hypothetical protein
MVITLVFMGFAFSSARLASSGSAKMQSDPLALSPCIPAPVRRLDLPHKNVGALENIMAILLMVLTTSVVHINLRQDASVILRASCAL